MRVRPSHHKNIKRRQPTSFFVSRIPVLQGFSPLFSLPKYTKVNPHQVPTVGLIIGVYLDILCAEDRKKRDAGRKLIANGIDPREKCKEVVRRP